MPTKHAIAAPTRQEEPAQDKERSNSSLGYASHDTASPERAKDGDKVPIGEVTETRVEQTGPQSREFTYVDIGSIDRRTKRIVDPKVIPASKAPSRAKQRLKKGDVLVSMTRPNLNAVALVPPDLDGAIGSTGFHVLRARDAEPGFLFYAVQSNEFIDAMCGKVQGALYPAVRPRDISSFCIPTSSLSRQRQIVAQIEKQFTRLEAGVDTVRRAQGNLKRYRAAVLKAACEGRLVPTEAELAKTENRKFETGEELLARILAERREKWRGRGKYKEPASPELADLPSLPEGWTWATTDQLTSVITDGEHITPERSESGVLLLSARNVLDGRISVDDVDYVPQHEYDRIAKRLVIAPGDVLLSCSGTVGRSAVVPEGLLFTLVRSVAVMKPLAGMGKFLSIALRSPLLKRQITAKQTQTAQANIFQGKIKVLCVPLPSLAEQTRIVAEVERRLSVVEELEAVVSADLHRATCLRQSILQNAFLDASHRKSYEPRHRRQI